MSRCTVHLPNMFVRMVYLPYLAPNEVAFRIDKFMTRLDLHQYLVQIYNVNVREIRIMNHRLYKKAIVVLPEVWSFPKTPPLEDLRFISKPNQRILYTECKAKDLTELRKYAAVYDIPDLDEQRRLCDPIASKKPPVVGYTASGAQRQKPKVTIESLRKIFNK